MRFPTRKRIQGLRKNKLILFSLGLTITGMTLAAVFGGTGEPPYDAPGQPTTPSSVSGNIAAPAYADSGSSSISNRPNALMFGDLQSSMTSISPTVEDGGNGLDYAKVSPFSYYGSELDIGLLSSLLAGEPYPRVDGTIPEEDYPRVGGSIIPDDNPLNSLIFTGDASSERQE